MGRLASFEQKVVDLYSAYKRAVGEESRVPLFPKLIYQDRTPSYLGGLLGTEISDALSGSLEKNTYPERDRPITLNYIEEDTPAVTRDIFPPGISEKLYGRKRRGTGDRIDDALTNAQFNQLSERPVGATFDILPFVAGAIRATHTEQAAIDAATTHYEANRDMYIAMALADAYEAGKDVTLTVPTV